MNAKHALITTCIVVSLAAAMHRGFSQSPPIVVGPGMAPNVGTPVNPDSLRYYGGYYGPNSDEMYYNSGANMYNSYFGPDDIPQTSAKMVTKAAAKTVSFDWEGEPRAIRSITISILDKNNAILATKTITTQPTRATLKRSPKATGYSVSVLYINGLTNTVVSPL